MPAIEIADLQHEYKQHLFERRKRALDKLTFSVEEGEIFGYLGTNGAGKTTTIKILTGLLRQTSGTAKVFGIDSRLTEARRHVGFQPESPYFYEYLTAGEALRFYAALCGIPRVERAKRAVELLEFVGLADAVKVRVGEFSKGMRQRLGIAQAIIHQPRLVILDEPMSGLDPVGRKQVRSLITSLGARGMTVFFSTHILSDVELICQRVALLVKGSLHAIGPVDKMVESRLQYVELLASNIKPEIAAELRQSALDADKAQAAGFEAGTAKIGEGEFRAAFADWPTADAAVAKLVAAGGKVRHVAPRSESLEEYFMRVNGVSRAEVGAWSGGDDR